VFGRFSSVTGAAASTRRVELLETPGSFQGDMSVA
jgi:hypothetical protein